jgi:hypothetical protein
MLLPRLEVLTKLHNLFARYDGLRIPVLLLGGKKSKVPTFYLLGE